MAKKFIEFNDTVITYDLISMVNNAKSGQLVEHKGEVKSVHFYQTEFDGEHQRCNRITLHLPHLKEILKSIEEIEALREIKPYDNHLFF